MNMPQSSHRQVPRPFFFPWGSGQIVEEAAFRGKHHEPCIQLLQFDDGTELIRFCSYTLAGRFERNSWLAGQEEIASLGPALKATPRISALLQKLISGN